MLGAVVCDSRLTSECNLSKGCGGVGIGWKKALQTCLVPGVQSDRICAITINLDRVTLLVIGVYLPTSDCTLAVYNDHLSEVEALINNHPDCCVIIGGDFNAYVAVADNLRGSSSQNSHGNLLSNMVCRNDLP